MAETLGGPGRAGWETTVIPAAPTVAGMRNGLLLAALALLVLAAPARADSIVYANDGHLYLAYPEGTQQTRLTTDEPLYGSPSVADDGTIAAVWGGGDVPTFYFRGDRVDMRAARLPD